MFRELMTTQVRMDCKTTQARLGISRGFSDRAVAEE